MSLLRKVSVACFVIAVIALCVTAGGLLAMHGLHVPPDTLLPQPISFALFFGGAMLAVAIVGYGLTDGGRPNKAEALELYDDATKNPTMIRSALYASQTGRAEGRPSCRDNGGRAVPGSTGLGHHAAEGGF
jgi:hypothetical protein